MKKLYIIILFLCSIGLFAQNRPEAKYIQTKENEVVKYQKLSVKAPNNKINKNELRTNSISSVTATPYLALEGFETFVPTGWLNWSPGSDLWQQTSSQFYSGSNSARVNAVTNSESWLVSPMIDLTTVTDPVLVFYNYFDDGSASQYNDEHIIKVSTDYTNNGNPLSATWDDVYFSDYFDYLTWYRKQVSLVDYAGQTIYIAFYYKGNVSGSPQYGTDWYIDDVIVEEKTIEDFEDEFNFPPVGWSIMGDEWEQGFDGYNSNYSALASYYYDPGLEQVYRWLVSPSYDLSVFSTPILRYYEQSFTGFGGLGTHEVYISNNGGSSWSSIRNTISNPTWELVELDLSVYAGQIIQIAFVYSFDTQGQEVDGSEWYIDDVAVGDFCSGTDPVPDCATLAGPPDGGTLIENFPVFWWQPPAQDVTTQSIKIWKEVGGNPVYFYEADLESTVIGLGPFTNNFENNTTYYWQVIPANCSHAAQNCPIWTFTTNDGEYNFGGGGPTQGGYVFANSSPAASGAPSQPIYLWRDISGSGTDVIGSMADDATLGPYNLGFTFNFFGNDYTEFYINSNGFITFSPEASAFNSFNYSLPNLFGQENIIAGYWKDFNPTGTPVTGSHVYYGIDNNDMVITYEKYPEDNGDANGWLTFQIIISPNGAIKTQYHSVGSTFDLNSGTVGIENIDETKGITYRQREKGASIFDGASPLALEFNSSYVNASVELKVYLEGPYNSANMNNVLGSSVPLTQPYSNTPWVYNGAETTDLTFINTNNIVDWVYLELRTGASAGTATTIVSKRAALLRNDGVILDLDGSVDIDFGGVSSGDYYIAVYHRNHLPVISSTVVTF